MELFYREYGQGDPLFILHGLYGSSDNWVTHAKKLQKEFRVILPDIRNHGNSPHSNSHSYPDMVEDLMELMDKLEIKSANFLGHSMGGKIAMFFADKYPEKVKKLIVADMTPRSFSLNDDEKGNAHFHLDLIKMMMEINPEDKSSFAEVDEVLSEKIQNENLRGFLLKNIRKADNKLEWKLNLKALYNNMNNIMKGLNYDNYNSKKLRMPALFLRGEKSDYISISEFKYIRFIFPKSEIISIPDAGHWLHAEQPKLFIKNVNYFLKPSL